MLTADSELAGPGTEDGEPAVLNSLGRDRLRETFVCGGFLQGRSATALRTAPAHLEAIAMAALSGGVAQHGFHVFAVYP